MLKKISAIILALVMALSSVSMAGAASNEVIPVVMVSGFGATTLAIDGEAVFPPSVDAITSAMGMEDLSMASISDFISRLADDYVTTLSKVVLDIVEPIRMNPDGTSYYNAIPIVSGAENTSLKAFRENDMLSYVPYTGSEFLDMESIGDKIGEENVFNFTYDWRLDYDLIADELNEYIQDVLELTGAKEVSIYTISQGGLVVGQYLYKYASLGQTHNVVFDTPVLGGTTFATDLFVAEPLDINLEYVLAIVSDVMHTELDLSSIAKQLGKLDIISEAINYARNDLILPAIYSCPAFLEMVPICDFDKVKTAYLDETENEAVIKMVDRFQNGFMSNITNTFEKATENGATVSIKASTGFSLCTNTKAYSDMIVDMKYSCGAICAPYGETFPSDYVQAVNTGKNHISPDRTVDISAGYWPDRTWVLNGLTHGAPEWCKDSLALLEALLLTDDVEDAYTHSEFPQFFESSAPTAKIKVSFENTNNGFFYAEEVGATGVLKVENTSLKTSYLITKLVSSTGAVDIDYNSIRVLGPGQTAYIPVTAKELKNDTIKVKFSSTDDPTKTSEKTFGVLVTNSYSGAVSDKQTTETPKDEILGDGTFNLESFLFNFVLKIIKTVLANIGITLPISN